MPLALRLSEGLGADLAPHREFVSTRFDEVKSAPARERKYGFHNLTASALNLGLSLFQCVAIEDDKRASAISGGFEIRSVEASVEPLI